MNIDKDLERSYIGKSVEITASEINDSIIGDNTKLNNSKVKGSNIGRGVIIENYDIKNSIIGDGTSVSSKITPITPLTIGNCIIGKNVKIEDISFKDSIIGDNVTVEQDKSRHYCFIPTIKSLVIAENSHYKVSLTRYDSIQDGDTVFTLSGDEMINVNKGDNYKRLLNEVRRIIKGERVKDPLDVLTKVLDYLGSLFEVDEKAKSSNIEECIDKRRCSPFAFALIASLLFNEITDQESNIILHKREGYSIVIKYRNKSYYISTKGKAYIPQIFEMPDFLCLEDNIEVV
ncbi:MAG: hypothetical protein ARM1_0568 [Candidatus Micrarchaeota archaeon]|nr:MAG: hypothetical protein ARM1_0568 [Candidatus Micrarchaeota archaeon]